MSEARRFDFLVKRDGKDAAIRWERDAAIAYRKAWAHPGFYGMYKRQMVEGYKGCRVVVREVTA